MPNTDVGSIALRAPPKASAGMDHSEELLAEVDEPPDEVEAAIFWQPTNRRSGSVKASPQYQRRESLLTRQLHSETEHTDEEQMPPPPRSLSTQSTWSNPSTASTAELTSDDGHSVPSPGFSPPLPPTHTRNTLPVVVKPLDQKVKIVGHDDAGAPVAKESSTEKSVEAGLGRKRCITFACRGNEEPKPVSSPTSVPAKVGSTSPPKRKCTLKFVCPTRNSSEKQVAEKSQSKRPVNPPSPARRPPMSTRHRGSDSTVTQVSPKSVRKTPVDTTTAPPLPTSQPEAPTLNRRFSQNSDDEDTGNEALRFHEFGTSEEEPEEWVQESTCHKTRLTVNDTLQKENVIRKTCEEVEEEALEEEEEDEEEDLEDELAEAEGINAQDMQEAIDEEDESDPGFHSDDEGGFADSDDESDDGSDFELWKPGPASTAPTSVERLDRLAIVTSQHIVPGSSVGSGSSGHVSPRSSRRKSPGSSGKTPAMTIGKPAEPDLPDSTDFVCGTLDEDRPLEQAYINRMKQKQAAKRGLRPQDIDPTFPTSDPEMDEEDDDDVDDEIQPSEDDELMHGDLDEIDAVGTAKPRPSARPRSRSNLHHSPPPSATRLHSPPPKRHGTCRSPPPPPRRSTARSPPPRKLFDQSSPRRVKSPAPAKRMTSPPNSPTVRTPQLATASHGLAGRPQLTHTASLPREGGFAHSKMASICDEVETSDTGIATEVPKRGAIDIVKGLERKRQRRKERLYQKMCAKAAAKGEKPYKVKPGKGAERMREVGLQLQQYQGKAEHILSL